MRAADRCLPLAGMLLIACGAQTAISGAARAGMAFDGAWRTPPQPPSVSGPTAEPQATASPPLGQVADREGRSPASDVSPHQLFKSPSTSGLEPGGLGDTSPSPEVFASSPFGGDQPLFLLAGIGPEGPASPTYSITPEPSTALLAALDIPALLLRRRHQRN
jgi:hypothetical protein